MITFVLILLSLVLIFIIILILGFFASNYQLNTLERKRQEILYKQYFGDKKNE